MLHQSDFLTELRSLFSRRVLGLDDAQKLEIVRRLVLEYGASRNGDRPPSCRWVPFTQGRRPHDDARHPGLGSSDHVGLVASKRAGENRIYLLFRLDDLGESGTSEYECDLSLFFAGPRGDRDPVPVPGWQNRPTQLRAFAASDAGAPSLEDVSAAERERSFVVALEPERDLAPGTDWSFAELDESLREEAVGGEDPYTFGHLFSQRVRAELRLKKEGSPLAAAQTQFDVCDLGRLGSLYQRVLRDVVEPDMLIQARAAGLDHLSHHYHPWYPVLLIGSDKAELYLEALAGDIVDKRRNLTDPRWLLRVGLYLEFLTCLGIFEAIRDDFQDLLTPEERHAFENAPAFAEIRRAVDPAAWRKVWALRQFVPPEIGVPRTGPVSARNLMAKKRATLAFLETHHEDLKRAIELAGPNDHNAQETWHRVFRDAERAVLRKTSTAFPELAALGPKSQEFVLWHRKGHLRGGGAVVGQVASWFGDQDGLYASACNQYRASMNEVAEWARKEGLMDFTGTECVPPQVSLLSAFMQGEHGRLAQLQRRDGYAGSIDVAADLPQESSISPRDISDLLSKVPLFRCLTEAELATLATAVRPITLGPVERIIVEGREGSSLFVLGEGNLEVLVRQSDGFDLPVATLDRGAVFGEMSLLTGEPRSATVRSVEMAVVYEIGQRQFAPLVAARPGLVEELAQIMEPRVRATKARSLARDAKQEVVSLGRGIRRFLLRR